MLGAPEVDTVLKITKNPLRLGFKAIEGDLDFTAQFSSKCIEAEAFWSVQDITIRKEIGVILCPLGLQTQDLTFWQYF